MKQKPEVQMLDGGGKVALLVPCGNYSREQRERSVGLGFRGGGHLIPSLSKQGGRRRGRSWFENL